jgi:hypothetical protein
VLIASGTGSAEEWQPFQNDGRTVGDLVADTATDLYLAPEIIEAGSLDERLRAMTKPRATVLVVDTSSVASHACADTLVSLRNSGFVDAVVYCSSAIVGAARNDHPNYGPESEGSLSGVMSFYSDDGGTFEQSLRAAAEYAIERSWSP